MKRSANSIANSLHWAISKNCLRLTWFFAIGLIHRLEGDAAINVMQPALRALKPGGRLLTIDPRFDPFRNPIARMLIRGDRGQNVRDKAGYEALAKAVFELPRIEVKHRAWIPYTHCFMECQQ